MPSKLRPFEELELPSKRRRRLPHWESAGATYFNTFRLGDAIPAGVLAEINRRAIAWLRAHNLRERHELWSVPAGLQEDFRRTVSVEEERWLDSGQGCCVLQSEECRAFLLETLHHFDGDRYFLDHYVIMPNHVHVLLQPAEGWSLGKIIATWKQFSARRINQLKGRNGDLWQHDSFDHIVRSWEKLEQCRRYIAANPVKARLREGEYHVGRGLGICQ